MCLLLYYLIILSSTSNGNQETKTDFTEKIFCSQEEPNFCLSVFTGEFNFFRAKNICEHQGGLQINLRNTTLRNIVSSILSLSQSSHNLVVNTERVMYGDMVSINGAQYDEYKEHNYNKVAVVLKKSYISSTPSKAHMNFNYLPLCKFKNCSAKYYCYSTSSILYNWFDARKYCLGINGELFDDVREAQALPLDRKNYWIGISNVRWRWTDAVEGFHWFSGTPKWSAEYFESLTTDCATLEFSNETFIHWKAYECISKTNLSVICKFNDTFALSQFKQSFTPGVFLGFIIAIVLIIIMITMVLLYLIVLKPRSQRKVIKQNSLGYCLVERTQNNDIKNILNYPHLNLPRPQLSEDAYDTIETKDGIYVNSDPEHTYANTNNDDGNKNTVYSLSKSIYSTEISNDEVSNSPVVVVENEIYDKNSKPSKFLSKLKLFKKTRNKSSADESLSTYESLSPSSFGRRSTTSDPTSPICDTNCHYSLGTNQHDDNDYDRINVGK